MVITRKVEFSASHVCRNPRLSEAENRKLFGMAANPHGHGHNYVVEVSLAGDPDPVTGMVLDLKELKEILNREVVEPYDHRFLNYEVPPFDRVIPTTENIARDIWRRLEPHLNAGRPQVAFGSRVRDSGPVRGLLRRRRRVPRDAAVPSSRPRTACMRPQLSEEENRRLYGKCNNPYGHGHNYVVEVSARGPLDGATGRAVDTALLDETGGAAGARPVRAPQPERGSGGVRAAWCRPRRTWRSRSAAV